MKSTRPLPLPLLRRKGRGSRALVTAALDPLAWILALAGFFDWISDNWLHALVLLGAAVVVWRETWVRASGRPVRPSVPLLRPGQPTRRGFVLGAGVVLVYAVVAGGFERYTWPLTVAVLVPAVLVLFVGWNGPLRTTPVPPPVGRRSAWLWSAVLVGAGLWELAALLMQPTLQLSSIDHPTVSYVMDSVLAGHAGRTVTLVGWLALGWFLLGRATGPDPAEEEPGHDVA